MSEKLVEYKTAKLSKEKNFEEKVHDWFDETGVSQKAGCTSHDEPIFKEDLTRQINLFAKKLNKSDVARPTQVQLKTWLREKHQIFIEIQTDCTAEPKFCFEINVFKGNPRNLAEKEWGWYFHKHEPWYLYYSYEDALEDALLEGLSLIGKDLIFDN